VYALTQDLNIPLILQPQLFTALSLVSWSQCLYYDGPPSLRSHAFKCTILCVLTILTFGGLETAFYFAIHPTYERGRDSAVEPFGIISAIIIAVALLPQYYAIYEHKAVIGISISFMVVDMLGGVFSDLSLLFRPGRFDIVAGVTYSIVVVMDGAVLVAALILNPRRAKKLKRGNDVELQATPSAPATSTLTKM
jgi:hypothetical protein